MRALPLLIVLSLAWVACGPPPSEEEEKTWYETFFQVKDYTDSVFTAGIEGPAEDPDGWLYVVNYQREGTIGRADGEGVVELFLDLPAGSTGNSICFNRQGVMFIADYTGHNILRVEPGSRQAAVFAHSDSFHQPNDLAIMDNGILFASDPSWADSTGQLWRIDTTGQLTLLEAGMGTVNGIEVSPGNQVLYVNESTQRRIWAYDLSPSGEISNKRLFAEFPDYGLDGMHCDEQGNLYVTRWGKGSVVILSEKGEKMHEVMLKGKKPSNIAFGDFDGKTCFVTVQDRGRIEAFRTEIPGRIMRMRAED
jgi:sugar lactone lactonase YvrE